MKDKKKIKWTIKKYDKESRKYDSKMKFILPDKFRKKVVDFLVKGSVLDVACGTGSLLKYANQKGLDCFGIDLSKGMIEQAIHKNPNVNFKVASYYNIPYENNNFDYVISTYALGGIHIKIKKVLKEMIRVCKLNGQVIILDWQKKEYEGIIDKLIIKIATFSEDMPINFRRIIMDLGYNPEIISLSYFYSIIKFVK